MNPVLTVARRELRALFDQPTGYILVVIFIGVNNFFFFRTAYDFSDASLRSMLGLFPWLFLFFIPAVTMRSVAEDRRGGTIEVMLAQPMSELQYIMGKFLGQVGFIGSAVGLTLIVPITLSFGSDQQVGVVIAQYVGTLLLATAMTAVGVWASSLTTNQITAFIIGVAAMFILVAIGWDFVLNGMPPSVSALAGRLGVLPHFRDIGRGVIDLRDVVYFLTVAAVFVAMAYNSLMRRKLSSGNPARTRLQMGVVVAVAGMIVINLLGRHISGRLDLTPGRAYTLSSATRDIVQSVDDIVTIKLFVSEELPPQLALLQRDLDDLLGDIESAGRGSVRLVEVDPSADEDVEAEARSLGIQNVQFNVTTETGLNIQSGFLGLAVQYLDQTETIPFVNQAADLEYRIASLIRQMTDSSRTRVGWLVNQSEQQQGGTYNIFQQTLSDGYDVVSLNLTADTIFEDDLSVAVMVGSPDSLSQAQSEQISAFLRRGGSMLIASSGMQITQQRFAMGRPSAWNTVLEPYDLTISENMVYDLASNQPIGVQTQLGVIPVSYPLLPWVLSTQGSPVNQGIERVLAPFTSTVEFGGTDSTTVTPLLITSQAAGVESNVVMLDVQREYPQTDLDVRTVAMLANPLVGEEEPEYRGRVAVVGTGQFVEDQLLRNSPDNSALLLNMVDWLAQDEGLMSIRSKNRAPPSIVFESDGARSFVKWFNIIGVPVLVIVFALVRLRRRRNRSRQSYQAVYGSEVAA